MEGRFDQNICMYEKSFSNKHGRSVLLRKSSLVKCNNNVLLFFRFGIYFLLWRLGWGGLAMKLGSNSVLLLWCPTRGHHTGLKSLKCILVFNS